MNIEFHAPVKEIKEWVIDNVRDELMKLHQEHKEISRAEVYFKERMNGLISEKTCEIDLSIFADSIKVRHTANNFDEAAREALIKLNETLDLHLKEKAEPPDEITSTIET